MSFSCASAVLQYSGPAEIKLLTSRGAVLEYEDCVFVVDVFVCLFCLGIWD